MSRLGVLPQDKLRSAGRLTAVFTSLTLAGCAAEGAPAAFRPQGPAARQINDLWWILFALGAATFVLVVGILLVALFRQRSPELTLRHSGRSGRFLVWGGGVFYPLIILAVTYGFTFHTLRQLAVPEEAGQPVVEVIGHQWWWEVRYPEQEVITANEIYTPTGETVLLRLSSADVIHSFWVPQLHGKMDLIPGRTNTWQLQADEPGAYWGLCAEFCGTQHAKMLFLVVAVPPAEYERWLAARRAPAPSPTDPVAQDGLAVFLETGCGECHAIRGTEAVGDLGPDLTHIASRLTLGAGAVRNNRGNLAGWIADPHGIKPGNLMPTTEITGPELQALLAYMETLE
ncbi:MAG: cytochrome c oxidase subunit II [Anaerolineales bacterium]|nr:cytochrome c oxidase subunit II [Anaerolineales bacterium]